MNYAQQIKHPMWQKKRLEVLTLNNYTCQECGTTDEELHVHHPFYRRGAMIWEYEDSVLQCLCHKCHKNVHAIDEQVKQATSTLDIDGKLFLLGVLEAKGLNRKLRETANYDENLCMLEVKGGEQHEHAFGVARFFEIPPMLLLNSVNEQGQISYAELQRIRRNHRISCNLPAFPPVQEA